MIAANNVAVKRLTALMDRYGTETVEAIMGAEIDATERQFRQTLLELPDGTFRARDYLEHDGHADTLYEVVVTVTKTGDTIAFDMTGTSPQAPGFINCTESGMRGAVLTGLLPILAPGLRWNEGVMRPVTITAPKGTLCNASWPAPTSAGTVSAAWIVQNVVVAALSRLVAFSKRHAGEGQAVTKGHMMVMTLAGLDRDGAPYGTFLLDSTAGGGGAFADHDGLDGSGDYVVPRPAIANVESNEANGPFLYLFRSFVPDSGGPGRSRGGAGCALAVTPYETESLSAMLVGHGVEVPNSAGQFGGLPGSCGRNFLNRSGGATAALASAAARLGDLDGLGLDDLGPKPGHMQIAPGDLVGYAFQGGGGYGDPLRRDPAQVLADVRGGHVTIDGAARFYGVVIAGDTVDAAATAARRLAIRGDRLGTAPAADLGTDGLHLVDGGRLACGCGADFGPASGDWKDHAATRVLPEGAYGPLVRLHPELEIREHVCKACGALHESEVVRRDEPSLATFALAL